VEGTPTRWREIFIDESEKMRIHNDFHGNIDIHDKEVTDIKDL